MPEYEQRLTEEDYEELRQQELESIADRILKYEEDMITSEAIEDHILEHLNLGSQPWRTCSHWSIARHADNNEFDPYEDLRLSAPADDIVASVAYHTVFTDLQTHLEQSIDELRQAHQIHLYLQVRVHGTTDVPDSPTELLDDFNRWLIEEHKNIQEDIDSLDYDEFNETHVRLVNTIDIWNDALRKCLYNWLANSYNEFPETLY